MRRKIEQPESARLRLRENAYLKIGDQLDAIMLGLETISRHLELPAATLEAIAHWREVKNTYPKQGKGKRKSAP